MLEQAIDQAVVLPFGPDAPATARRVVQDVLRHLPPDVCDDAVLLVSELVTNAVRHGRPDVHLSVVPTPGGARIAVADGSPSLPSLPSPLPTAADTSGRGLMIMDRIAAAWGVERHAGGTGKTTWFEVRAAG